MARMSLSELLAMGSGRGAYGDLFKAKNLNSVDQWGTAGGNNEAGNTVYVNDPNQQAIDAYNGYTFDWQGGDRGSGVITAYDPQGNQVGQYVAPERDSALKGMAEWLGLAGAGFGLAGLAGLGPLGGALGGASGAGQVGSSVAGAGSEAAANLAAYGGTLTPAEIAGTAAFDIGAAGAGGVGAGGAITGGAGLTAGGISGAGITAPALGGTAGLGAGLGTVGAAGGAGGAAAGSFWGGLAKAAIPTAVSVGASLIAGNKAAGAQRDATTAANNLQRYVYDTTRADNMPALEARNSALAQMQELLKNPGSITTQPGYQFGLDQGTKTLNNGAAARGMTYSGAAGKALTKFGQDYAGSKLDQSFNRLSALASSGQSGAGTIAGAAGQYGQTVGNNLTAMGDANAARYIVGGNAIGNAVNSLTAYGQRQGWWGG